MIRRKEIDSLKDRIDKIEENVEFLIQNDLRVSHNISEEIAIKHNCAEAFEQGEQATKTLINRKIDDLLEKLDKKDVKMFYKKTIIRYLSELRYGCNDVLVTQKDEEDIDYDV